MHYDLMFYRIPFYNLLQKRLKELDYNLIIWFYDIQKEIDKSNMEFQYLDNNEVPMNIENLKRIVKDRDIVKIINFLNPSKPGYIFYINMISYLYLQKKELIYYGHGINLEKQDNFVSNQVYNILHFFYKSIILYTPNEKKFLWKIHWKKIHIAYNTLCLNGYEEMKKINKEQIKTDLGFNANDRIVLFSGRVQKRKRLDVLLDAFDKLQGLGINNVKLVIVGPGMNEEYDTRAKRNELIYNMGPIYNKNKISQIFYSSDMFCIPGHIGLGLIEAMYWGVPIMTMNVKHAPEIYYLENGINGYMVNNENEIFDFIKELSEQDSSRKLIKLSEKARYTYESKALPDMMIQGFEDAIKGIT